jgi:ABC-2 type transport system ATP-binding protein
VGYLPENHRIPRHHTGNSALAFFGSLSGLSGREIRSRRPALLKAVGLAEWGKTPIKKYSKGMLQRLGLAQAMLHDPQLLILDEPTDGVDPVGRSEMRALLVALRAQGKTIFINSHLLQELELVCDRVAILDRGRLLHQGRLDELTVRAQADVRIVVAGPLDGVRVALGESSAVEVRALPAEQVEVTVKTGDQRLIDDCVDRLRARSFSLISMSPSRQTLEEAFLEILARSRNGT